jgi:hypothetical protein
MKKIFLCLAVLALLGSNPAFTRGGGGHGGGGHGGGGGGGHRMHGGGGRGHGGGGHGGGRHHGGGHGGHGHHGGHGGHGGYGHHGHWHGGHWYNYNSGWYLFGGLWYPFWYWPYRTETDIVVWQEAPPADAKYVKEDELDDLEEQNVGLRERQDELNARLRALETRQKKLKP